MTFSTLFSSCSATKLNRSMSIFTSSLSCTQSTCSQSSMNANLSDSKTQESENLTT